MDDYVRQTMHSVRQNMVKLHHGAENSSKLVYGVKYTHYVGHTTYI
jgi:hypothetical protein